MNRAKREALNIAQSLGHTLTPYAPYAPYGDKEYAYCENPDCKAGLIILVLPPFQVRVPRTRYQFQQGPETLAREHLQPDFSGTNTRPDT